MIFVTTLIELDELVYGYLQGLKENRSPEDYIVMAVSGEKCFQMKNFVQEFQKISAILTIINRLVDNTQYDCWNMKELMALAQAGGHLSESDEKMFKEYL